MFVFTNTANALCESVGVSNVLAMLHGNLCIAIVPAGPDQGASQGLLELAQTCEQVDLVMVRPREIGANLHDFVEEALGGSNSDSMLDPNLPVTVVLLDGEAPLQEALAMFEQGGHSVVSVQEVSESNFVLTPKGMIEVAFPRLIDQEPLRFVSRAPGVAVFTYSPEKINEVDGSVGCRGLLLNR